MHGLLPTGMVVGVRACKARLWELWLWRCALPNSRDNELLGWWSSPLALLDCACFYLGRTARFSHSAHTLADAHGDGWIYYAAQVFFPGVIFLPQHKHFVAPL